MPLLAKEVDDCEYLILLPSHKLNLCLWKSGIYISKHTHQHHVHCTLVSLSTLSIAGKPTIEDQQTLVECHRKNRKKVNTSFLKDSPAAAAQGHGCRQMLI